MFEMIKIITIPIDFLVRNVFFYKWRGTIFCVIWCVVSFFIEIYCGKKGAFSASGSIFTLAGLFLNIKLTSIYHLRHKDGEPYDVNSQYGILDAQAQCSDDVETSIKETKVKEVISDEIWGATLMVIGTILWGYGSFFVY